MAWEHLNKIIKGFWAGQGEVFLFIEVIYIWKVLSPICRYSFAEKSRFYHVKNSSSTWKSLKSMLSTSHHGVLIFAVVRHAVLLCVEHAACCCWMNENYPSENF